MEKQANFFFSTSIINKEYFQDEAFWLELCLAILFLSVRKKHLEDVGEWDRTSLLQIFFIVAEERSVFDALCQELQRNVPGLSLGIKDYGHCVFVHACSAVWQEGYPL